MALPKEILDHLNNVALGHAALSIALPFVVGILSIMLVASSAESPLAPIGLLLGMFLVLAIVFWVVAKSIPRWRQRIAKSDLIERLATGTLPNFMDAVPWPFSFFFASARSWELKHFGDLKVACQTLAANIDWYMKPTPRLVRISWIAIGVAYATLLSAPFVLPYVMHTEAMRWTQIASFLIIVCTMSVVVIEVKRWIWSRALMAEMQYRLETSYTWMDSYILDNQ